MTFADFKAYFDENKDKDEVKKLTGKAEMTDPAVTEFLESDAGRPIIDRYINRAVRSHDEKRQPEIDRLIADAVEKAKKEGTMSAEDKVQKQLEELRGEIKKRDADLARRDMVTRLRAKAEEMHVPLDIAVDLDNPALTEEKAVERMTAYATRHKEQIAEEVNRRLGQTPKPGTGTAPEGKADVKKMSFEELVRLEEAGELNDRIAQ